jgi:hypothetical protein
MATEIADSLDLTSLVGWLPGNRATVERDDNALIVC